jgi:Kef-type K+ transport system membrane component KefB
MTPFLQLIFMLAAILIAAKLAGYLSTRIKQPSVFGELLVGVLLGPSLLNITHLSFITDTHLGDVIYELGEIGVLLLMFLAGLELHISEIVKNTRVSVYTGILGVIFPLGFGYGIGLITGMSTSHAIYLGLALSATSVSISAQTLMEMGKLKTRVGLGLLGSAVFDDILVILFLSIFLAFTSGTTGITAILLVIIRMAGFLILSIAFGLFLLPWISRKVSRLPISQGSLVFAIVIIFLYGIAAEIVGSMAAITGSFIAGLMFSRTTEKSSFESGIRSLSYGFFVPIFFVSIGLSMNLREISGSYIWMILIIVILSIIGKILGAGLGAKLAGLPALESVQIGIGMISRGEVGLIIAKIGIDNALLNNQTFSAIIAVVLFTTLLTPPLLRASFVRGDKRKAVEISKTSQEE